MSDVAFRTVGCRVEYDRQPVLHGIDLEVASGEVLAVLGANGSGKSTLVKALLGLVPLASGRVEVHGRPLRAFRDWSRIGYVPQRLNVGGGVPATVREVVAAGRVSVAKYGWFSSRAERAAVHRALDRVGLADRAADAVHELSGGQQQRVLIARALAAEPDTFVMDEPMAGVDAASQAALAGTVSELASRGSTVVVVLHELGPLAPVIRRSIVLAEGRIAHDGRAPEPVGDCARPGHDHVHPHAGPPARTGLPLAPVPGGGEEDGLR
ncbi:metal ABC transporter ATP-binding protein [Allonocardiopsis opalescens]|uniref:Zinc transport system ATP-binding protein n=1 Tax=Allonocardiopsis opalescens TaxID=1144618 RepID=A0A2T0QFU1_9ACTN|nr:ABC transporter ATP-binding protein [Allonocardiopsis opalescens]PRY02711.1 zinc transport system ATP-binding protein [Allonocardiopsis opalescens]